MSDDKHESHTSGDEQKHNLQGVPNGERSTDADTASGGAPEDPDDDGDGSSDADGGTDTSTAAKQSSAHGVDPDTGTDPDGAPVDNPSGG